MLESVFTTEKLGEALQKEGYEVQESPPTEEFPFPMLAVTLTPDYRKRERTVQVLFKEQWIGPSLTKDKNDPAYVALELHYRFPFKVLEESIVEMGRMCCFLNHYLDLPGFDLDEVNQTVAFRHISLEHKKKVDILSIRTMLGVLILASELFCPSIEEVALGQRSFNSVIEESLKNLEEIVKKS